MGLHVLFSEDGLLEHILLLGVFLHLRFELFLLLQGHQTFIFVHIFCRTLRLFRFLKVVLGLYIKCLHLLPQVVDLSIDLRYTYKYTVNFLVETRHALIIISDKGIKIKVYKSLQTQKNKKHVFLVTNINPTPKDNIPL